MRIRLLLIFIVFLTFAGMFSCADIKTYPEYKGVDPKVSPYYQKYVSYARIMGYKFDKPLTIGFKKLSDGVVGRCTVASTFREIDVDPDYWEAASEITKRVLIYHESTHCLCNRMHDYGASEDNSYGDMTAGEFQFLLNHMGTKVPNGYYNDRCPLSIMHPILINDACYSLHESEYLKELWLRCDPW